MTLVRGLSIGVTKSFIEQSETVPTQHYLLITLLLRSQIVSCFLLLPPLFLLYVFPQ